MDKQHIVDEIKRTTKANGGVPLGRARFRAETGIKESGWYAKHWRSWGDAVREAGYQPNRLQGAYDEEFLIRKLVDLIRELGKYPVAADVRMRARADKSFPSHTAFERIGKKAERAKRVIDYCKARHGFDDVIAICIPIAGTAKRRSEASSDGQSEASSDGKVDFGFVYLLRSGRYYKIGRTNSVGRREYELGIQLPENPTLIHKIKTDDPVGIEKYWHRRFKKTRKGGEWFELKKEDVEAFKRRKFM